MPKVVKLLSNFAFISHLSRQKCCLSIILAMIQTRKVQFHELGLVLNDDVKPSSNEDRIQRFFAEAEFDEDQLAFLLSLFLTLGKVDICIDRTEWDFGKLKINLLVLSACCHDLGLPLYVDFLDNNSGNSNTAERIEIFEKLFALLGKDRIDAIYADREFIGEDWFNYLIKNKIKFFIRIPKSYLLTVDGKIMKADQLLGQRSQCKIDGVTVINIVGLAVGIKKCQDKKGNPDLLIVLTNAFAYEAIRSYKKRWSIEAMFQDFKGQGFNIEETHIPIAQRVVKLIYLVAIAYAFCIHLGWYLEKGIEQVSLKNHGYRVKSLFRKGMDKLRQYFFKKRKPKLEFWHTIVNQFIRMARLKLIIYNNLGKS